ncbi:hypothetical protein A4D02_19495 [Niastella koreensis]|uniref:Lipoprotein n=2 Tax=Niastella koreensis TaxID=354356 RepID=G8TCR8_NIAKG|nr:DUF4136 domain-containing protein [Niastella koreensis]AEW03522.1 lipoprotein [Niastella koreensis GR20-10]OQP53882.1 hypothetical protein A4D02_19495 [Niastella koreensis]
MKKIVIPVLMAAGILAMTSCKKDVVKNLQGDEGQIYVTNHSDSVNFSSFKTFSIADSVAVIENNRLYGYELSGSDAAYIQAVKDQLTQRGYTLVNKNQNPDLGITISQVYSTSTGVIDYGSYYGGYDPYYWGYGGYGYYYPSYYGTYSITEGAMSIDAFDLKDANESKSIKDVWSGLLRGSGVFSVSAANNGVKALFDQSSYFKAN